MSDIESRIKEKIERIGVPLKEWDISINYGIKTGYNEAFIISGSKRDELIAEDPKSAEIIRPILRGRDIKSYGYDFADLWLINTHNGIRGKGIEPVKIDQYPAVQRHLDNFYKQLEKRLDKGATPYNLRNCAYTEDFYRQKIVWGEISDRTKFAIDLDGKYIPEATSFLMTGNSLLYLLGYLNSSISEYLFSQIGTTTGVGTVRWKKFTIEQLRVPKISKSREEVYINLVLEIIENSAKRLDTISLEKKIDEMIFQDFGLNDEEIQLVANQRA